MPKAAASVPFLVNPQLSNYFSARVDSNIVTACVQLDGRCAFEITAKRTELPKRLPIIQQKFTQISRDYLQSTGFDLNVQVRQAPDLQPVIFVNNQELLTVTDQDASLRQTDSSTLAEQIARNLRQKLKLSKKERQPNFLVREAKIAGGTGLLMMLTSWSLIKWRFSKKDNLSQAKRSTPTAMQLLAKKLTQQQQQNLKEVKRRLFQLAQVVIWGGGTLIILNRFPQTRSLASGILTFLQFPLKVSIVGVLTYVAVRLSYAITDRCTSVLVDSRTLLSPETTKRIQLRVSTISGVTKSVATITLVIIGFLSALMSLGIDIIPLLAGASIVGVAISLASQNLIKDAINGFLIILEDQYALGDMISVGTATGLVENLNLRMTQIRDTEGRLITIPNSEIKVVANLSSRWSQADLNIPVGFQADIDAALNLIATVGLDMTQDSQWQQKIVESPKVLGIDNFSDRGVMVRVLIKTKPLKQLDVAREYRRRTKIALDKAGMSIPFP
ncbi:MAG: mechanosensitive ion channel family protein [Scytonematopsis contorta HA4267-MV1]|nr:mechanosensitive ion channel family protein [Scytonematopsis contorta HA4267-MV1]